MTDNSAEVPEESVVETEKPVVEENTNKEKEETTK